MNKNIDLGSEVDKINLLTKLILKLKQEDIYYLKDIWKLKKLDLRKIGITNKETNDIIIQLQLLGLDLNRKIYK